METQIVSEDDFPPKPVEDIAEADEESLQPKAKL
jgi:hypothetical protein